MTKDVTAKIEPTRISLRFNVGDVKLIEKIPCAFRNSEAFPNLRLYPKTLAILLRIEKYFGERVEYIDPDNFREWVSRWRIAKQYAAASIAGEIPGAKMPVLHPLQGVGFWFAYHLPGAMLAHSMGYGKSKVILDLIRVRNHMWSLIVTTAGAIYDWSTHVAKHWPDNSPPSIVVLDQKLAAKKAAVLRTIFETGSRNQRIIFVISYDNFWREPIASLLLSGKLDFCALDESQHAAGAQGRRGKFVEKLARRVPFRLATSGTAMNDSWKNLFAQFRFVDPGVFGTNEKYFLDRYGVWNAPEYFETVILDAFGKPKFDPTTGEVCIRRERNPNPRFIVGVQNKEELHKLFHTVAHYAPPGLLDLPKPIPLYRFFKLSKPAQRVYDELETEFITELDDGTVIESTNILSKFAKLEQVACGFIGQNIIDPETGEIDCVEWHELDDGKIKLLAEIMAEIPEGEPVVIFCLYRHDLLAVRNLCQKIGRTAYEQSGRYKQKFEWMAATGGEVLIGQMQSASEAHDFTRSCYFIFYSIGFHRGRYEQATKRGDRPGQTRRPSMIHIVAKGTIDERKYKAIEKKTDVIREILTGMQRRQNDSLFDVQQGGTG